MNSFFSPFLKYLLLLVLATSLPVYAEEAETEFARAVALMQSQRYRDAIPVLQALARTTPDNPNVLWNLGVAAAQSEENALALETWQAYRQAAPGDWRGLTKLIQSHQALGQLAARDAERQALLRFRASLPKPSRATLGFYCRDIFRVGDQALMALEFFEPSPEHPVHYRFALLDKQGRETSFITLSEDAAPGDAGTSPRRYRLEHIRGANRTAVSTLTALPSYDALRALVVATLSGGQPDESHAGTDARQAPTP